MVTCFLPLKTILSVKIMISPSDPLFHKSKCTYLNEILGRSKAADLDLKQKLWHSRIVLFPPVEVPLIRLQIYFFFLTMIGTPVTVF